MKKRPKDMHLEHIRRVGSDVQECIETLAKENDVLRIKLDSLEHEKAAGERKIKGLEEEVAEQSTEHQRIMGVLDELTSDNSNLHRDLTEVLSQSNDLTNLYVSSYQLHSSLERENVIAALQEIIINLIGSEKFLILGLNEAGRPLDLIGSFGVKESELGDVEPDGGVVGRVLEDGETYLADGDRRQEYRGRPVESCFPMFLNGEVFGAVVIFELLPQKQMLTPGDRELFGLLSTHAASALYCSELHGKRSE